MNRAESEEHEHSTEVRRVIWGSSSVSFTYLLSLALPSKRYAAAHIRVGRVGTLLLLAGREVKLCEAEFASTGREQVRQASPTTATITEHPLSPPEALRDLR